jgi:uncharacterized membrane protein YfbV (UPF0208 family)
MENYKPEINFSNQLNSINSIEGQLEKLRAELTRAKTDPRYKARAQEIARKINQLEKAKYNLFNKK